MIKLTNNIRTNFTAFKVLVWINIRTTILSTKLGYVWWILDPLILMVIYYFLIKGIFGRGGENYHIFVLCGIINWQFFAKSLNASINTLTGNRAVIRQISFPLPVLIAVPVCSNVFFASIGTLVVLAFQPAAINIYALAIVPLLILIGLFSYGFCLFISVCSVFFTDVRKIIPYVIRAGFFLSPVLYDVSRLMDSPDISDPLKKLFQLNPMAWIIPAVRDIILHNEMYDFYPFLIRLIAAILIVQLGLLYTRFNSSTIIKML